MAIRVLFAGEGAEDGPACYLLGVLASIGAATVHVPSFAKLSARALELPFDVLIFGDYPRAQMSAVADRAVARQVRRGAGLLMIGGWASFAAPWGGWRGSTVADLLPVACLRRDDRRHFPTGALVIRKRAHPILEGIPVQQPPIIGGLNAVRVKPGGRVVLAARRILPARHGYDRWTVSLEPQEHPLLVVREHGGARAAALTTDVAPHWCAGLLDWGARRVQIPVNEQVCPEVGHLYVRFLANLVRWLAGSDR